MMKDNESSRQRQQRLHDNSSRNDNGTNAGHQSYRLEERDGSVLASLLKYKTHRQRRPQQQHHHHHHHQQQQPNQRKKRRCCFGFFSLTKQRRRILLLVVFPCLLFMSQFWFIRRSEKKHIRHFLITGKSAQHHNNSSKFHHHLSDFKRSSSSSLEKNNGQQLQFQTNSHNNNNNNSPYAYVFLLTGAHPRRNRNNRNRNHHNNKHNRTRTRTNKNDDGNSSSSSSKSYYSTTNNETSSTTTISEENNNEIDQYEYDNYSYQLGFFSILSIVHSLRQFGSTADFVIMVQISARTPHRLKKLKKWEVELLEHSNIHLRYIPKFASPELEVYYGLSLEKFRILQLTEYDRVMFVDHTVISVPKCNLDYIFEMSLHDDLKPNVVFGRNGVPSDGSLFILEPNLRDYDDLVQTIVQHEQSMYNATQQEMGVGEGGSEATWPFGWNETEGWGHVIDPEDPWVTRKPLRGGTKWTFFGAYADQGLLYHYTKYMNRRVSFVREDTVEHWDFVDDLSGDTSTPSKKIENGLFDKHRPQSCHLHSLKSDKRPTPYQDINYISNDESTAKQQSTTKKINGDKPWMINRPELEVAMLQTSAYIQILRQQDPKKIRESDQWLLNLLEALSEAKSFDRQMAERVYVVITTMTDRHYRQQEQQRRLQSSSDASGSSESVSSLFYYYTHKPPVGRASTLEQVHLYIKEKVKHGWTQYLDDSQRHQQYLNTTDYYDSRKRHIRTSSSATYDVKTWCNATLSDMKQKLSALASPDLRSSSTSAKVDRHRMPKHKWAYAFFLGSAMSDRVGMDYRYAILSVISAVKSLRNHGSIADMVLMVQISARSDATQLDEEDETLLKQLNIQIEYIPKLISPEIENFYSLGMEKFRVLSLVQYSRVMYMDYDTLPLCNMDYLFELSEPFTGQRQSSMLRPLTSSISDQPLKENIVLGLRAQPSDGSLFILKPNMDDWVRVQEIIRLKDMYSSLLPYPHFDPDLGWGHPLETPTQWLSPSNNNTKWNWDLSFADTGLLYHITKYVKRSVSFIENGRTENWGSDPNTGDLFLESTTSSEYWEGRSCMASGSGEMHPAKDFRHFADAEKPWSKNIIELNGNPENRDHQLWYSLLNEALRKINMNSYASKVIGNETKSLARPSSGRSLMKQYSEYLWRQQRLGWRLHRTDVAECP